jgi:hypothetical protein
MRPTTESALLAMVIGGGQRLLFRFSERGNEAFFHGSVRVRNPGMDITRKLYIRHLAAMMTRFARRLAMPSHLYARRQPVTAVGGWRAVDVSLGERR